MQNLSTPLLVVAVALIDGGDRILLQKRSLEGVHGGLWEIPGGKVEHGEALQSAAVREIEEELGIRLSTDQLVPCSFASGPRDETRPDEPLVILLYTCRYWDGDPRCLAGQEIGWILPDEAMKLEMPPLDYPLLQSLHNWSSNNSA